MGDIMKSKLFKRLTAGVLSLFMLASALPAGSDFTGLFGSSIMSASAETQSGTCGENATWEFDDETGVLTISGSGAMTDYNSPNSRPWHSFSGDITKVVVEKGITTIGERAFYGLNNLKDAILPEGVTIIGEEAFSECSSLVTINSPESLETIDNFAFQYCFARLLLRTASPTLDKRLSLIAQNFQKLRYRTALHLWAEKLSLNAVLKA